MDTLRIFYESAKGHLTVCEFISCTFEWIFTHQLLGDVVRKKLGEPRYKIWADHFTLLHHVHHRGPSLHSRTRLLPPKAR